MVVNITILNNFGNLQMTNMHISDGPKFHAAFNSETKRKQWPSECDLDSSGKEEEGLKQKDSDFHSYSSELSKDLIGNHKGICNQTPLLEINHHEVEGVDLVETDLEMSSVSTNDDENEKLAEEINSRKHNEKICANPKDQTMTNDEKLWDSSRKNKDNTTCFDGIKTQNLYAASSKVVTAESYCDNICTDFEDTDADYSCKPFKTSEGTQSAAITERIEDACKDETNISDDLGDETAANNSAMSKPFKKMDAYQMPAFNTTADDFNEQITPDFESKEGGEKLTKSNTSCQNRKQASNLNENKQVTLGQTTEKKDTCYLNTDIKSQQISKINFKCKRQTKTQCSNTYDKESLHSTACLASKLNVNKIKGKNAVTNKKSQQVSQKYLKRSLSEDLLQSNKTEIKRKKDEESFIRRRKTKTEKSLPGTTTNSNQFMNTTSFIKTRKEELGPKKNWKTGILTKELYEWSGEWGCEYFKNKTLIDLHMRPITGKSITWIPSRLIMVLCLLAFFGAGASQEMYNPSLAVLNTTAMTFSGCSVPPTECPNADDDMKHHMYCINPGYGCKQGFYFCDKTTEGWLVEGCFERNKCEEGTTNRIQFSRDPLEAKLVCKVCPEGLIEQTGHDSKENFRPGCDVPSVSIYIMNNQDKMKKVFNGYPTSPDLYICDTNKGFSNEYKFSLCSIEADCYCINTVKCNDDKPELLPNGTCDYHCSVERNIFDNFSCSLYTTTRSSSGKSVTTSQTTLNTSSERPSTENPTTTVTQEMQDKNVDQGPNNIPSNIIIMIVGVLGSIASICVICGFVCYCWKIHRERRNQDVEQGDTTTEKGPNIELTNINVQSEYYIDSRRDVIINKPESRQLLPDTDQQPQLEDSDEEEDPDQPLQETQQPEPTAKPYLNVDDLDVDGPSDNEEEGDADQTYRKHVYERGRLQLDPSLPAGNSEETERKYVFGSSSLQEDPSLLSVDSEQTERKKTTSKVRVDSEKVNDDEDEKKEEKPVVSVRPFNRVPVQRMKDLKDQNDL